MIYDFIFLFIYFFSETFSRIFVYHLLMNFARKLFSDKAALNNFSYSMTVTIISYRMPPWIATAAMLL